MRVFKIVLSVFALLLLSFPAFAAEQVEDKKFKIVTSFTVIADIAANVAGDAAIVESITKPGAEIHDYRPTPKDIARAQDADLVLWNGLNLERWFSRFLVDLKDVPDVVVSAGVEPLSIYKGPYTGKPNPHGWMSLLNGKRYVENIRAALVEYDPDNAAIYNENSAAYVLALDELSAEIQERLQTIPEEQRWLVTSEGAFSYLAADLGFQELYIWPINAERQGTPQQLKNVIETINTQNIPVIFSESTISDRPARQVAEQTGIHYGGVLYVDSLSKEGGAVPSYLEMLRITTDTILRGFEDALADAE